MSTFDNDSVPLLSDLIATTEIEGHIDLSSELDLQLVFGVDALGYYVDPASFAMLSIDGVGEIQASAGLGEELSLEGSGVAKFADDGMSIGLSSVSLTPLRTFSELFSGLELSASGQATIELSQRIPEFGLQWSGVWDLLVENNTTSVAASVDFPTSDDFVLALIEQFEKEYRQFVATGIVEQFESIPLPFAGSTDYSVPNDGSVVADNTTEDNAYLLKQLLQVLERFPADLDRVVADELPGTGVVYTQGDRLIGGDVLRHEGLSGSGVKIGLISDGIRGLDTVSTDAVFPDILPGSVHVSPQFPGGRIESGSGAEGTAMIEIIQDIAPQAEIFFVGVGGDSDSERAFIDGVQWFIDNEVDIVVDDIGLWSQSFFFDDDVANAIDQAITNENLLYISAAGNDADQHYQSIFNPIEVQDVLQSTTTFHRFGSQPETQHLLPLSVPANAEIDIVLQWSSPDFNGDRLPYDFVIALIDEQGNRVTDRRGDVIFDSGRDLVPPKSQPYRLIELKNRSPEQLEVSLVIGLLDQPEEIPLSGADQFPSLEVIADAALTNRLTVPGDSVFGHAAVAKVLTVGAVDVNEPGADTPRVYSSYGPMSEWNQAANSIVNRHQIVDVVAPDGVSVSGAAGFGSDFNGTSAAAPHVAGIGSTVARACSKSRSGHVKSGRAKGCSR